MKVILICAIVLASAAMAGQASAAEGRWCAIYGNAEGGKNCYFATHRQCMADISGKSGWCQRNTDYGHAQYLRYR
jgi:Protein of unknown function (DUF3551)